VVNMTDSSNIDMWFYPLKYSFCHLNIHLQCAGLAFFYLPILFENLFSNFYNQLTAKIADRFSSYLSLTWLPRKSNGQLTGLAFSC